MCTLIFNDDAFVQYSESECCESVQRLYSELEQPPFLYEWKGGDDLFTEETATDDMNFEDLLPSLKKKDAVQPPRVPQSLQTKVKVVVSDPPPSASVFRLFGYFQDAWQQALSLPFDDIKETVQSRCGASLPRLCEEVVQRRPQIERTIQTLVMRLVLELFTVDERGGKIKQIMNELEETYLLGEQVRRGTAGGGAANQPKRRVIRNGRANFINMDSINRCLEKTYGESTSTEKEDTFHKRCSDAKKRGRRSAADRNQQPNRIDQIKAGHILSQKSVAPITYDEEDDRFYTMANVMHDGLASPSQPQITNYGIQSTVDFYPVYLKVLSNFYHCVPSTENYGIYLRVLNAAVRLLTPRQWPMQGLVKSLINAERIFPLKKVSVPMGSVSGGLTANNTTANRTRYRCAYSGLALKPGEQVWLLRVLCSDGHRHVKWATEGRLPPQPMTAPEFTRSVHAYLIKCSVMGACSLFFTPSKQQVTKQQQQVVKQQQPPLSEVKPRKSLVSAMGGGGGLAKQRIMCVNTLWLLLNQLRHFIDQTGLAPHIYGVHQRQISYQLLMQQLTSLFLNESSTGSECNNQSVRGALFIGTLVNDLPHRSVPSLLSDDQAQRYVAMMHDIVLDFVDLMFPHYGGTSGGTGGDKGPNNVIMMRRTFSLYRLDIKNDEKTKIPTIISPVVNNGNDSVGTNIVSALLTTLFAQSDARMEGGGSSTPSPINGGTSYDEKVLRMERLEKMLLRHPLVFMALFQVIYEPHGLVPQQQLSFKKAHKYLQAMGLFFNTDPSLIAQSSAK